MLRLHWRKYRSKYPWIQVMQTWRFWLLVLFTVVLMVYAIASLRGGPVTFMEQEIGEIWVGNIEFDFLTGLYFLKEGKDVFLRGLMPDHMQMNGRPTHCGKYNASQYLCANWYPKVKLEVENTVEEHATCQSLTWTRLFDDYKPQTCFSMSDSKWYGGSLFKNQMWPLNKIELQLQPYRTHDVEILNEEKNTIGNVLDWFWINSMGVAVIADSTFPLHISVNQSGERLLCLHAQSRHNAVLKYKICKAKNLRKIQRFVISKFIHLPINLPKESHFQKPMWSTYPVYKDSLNQENLLKYTKEIMDNDFERSVVDIYDTELLLLRNDPFEKAKFSNSHQSLMLVREYLFETYLSVSPFVPVSETVEESRLVLDPTGKPLELNYKGKNVNVVDLLNQETYSWYVKAVKELSLQFSLDGFHLIGGEMNLLDGSLGSPSVDAVIDIEAYAKKVSSLALSLRTQVLTSSALRSQLTAPFIVLTSKSSSWGYDGGLKSVIPSVLTLGILGYPFVIPNIIGGPGTLVPVNATSSELKRNIPDRDLYLRWAGLAAYMPCMMFSFPPWLYDVKAIHITQRFAKIHSDTVAPLINKAIREFEITGSPIIRPLWWIDPTDGDSQTIDDEFFIGDTLLVAPILEQGKFKRDIFIPNGRWLDSINNKEVEGKLWLRDYDIQLDQVATFTKLK